MARFEYDCTSICNEKTIFPAMKELVEEGMGIREAARFVSEDSGGQVTAKRAECVWQNRMGNALNKADPNKFYSRILRKLKKVNKEMAAYSPEGGEVPERVIENIVAQLAMAISSTNKLQKRCRNGRCKL